VATTLTYWIWWAWLMALLASLLEIEGRLMFGVHWFSDVSVVIQRWFVKGLTAGAA
jgi:membrane-associated phospholipid phosphatase